MFIIPIEPMKPMTLSESGKTLYNEQNTNTFQNVLDNAINSLNETNATSRNDAYQLAFGNVDNIGEITINTLKAEAMIQTTVQITSRVLNAYKEIMNIQI
ncbi:MAG: flagellar hook-basal body complex protein FliE [Clostridiales bacterium]|nr:flagellar hook-basal body complex protein FliE [Clostridiales bacterium]